MSHLIEENMLFVTRVSISCGTFGYGFSIRKPDYTTNFLDIWDVYPGGPADISGINPGDMIKSINGSDICGLTELQSLRMIENSRKLSETLCLEIIKKNSNNEKEMPIKNIGSIAKLAITGGVSLEELARTKAHPTNIAQNRPISKFGHRTRHNRKTIPSGSVSTHSQSNLVNFSNCENDSEKNVPYESMTELSGRINLTRVGGLLDYRSKEKEVHRNSTTSADIWMHRIHHNIVPQPYKSPKESSRNTVNYQMNKHSDEIIMDANSVQRLENHFSHFDETCFENKDNSNLLENNNNRVSSSSKEKTSSQEYTRPQFLHRTSSNISLVEIAKPKENQTLSKINISDPQGNNNKWHQVILKRMPKDYSHGWENYQIRIIEKAIELRPDKESFDKEIMDDTPGFIRLPIKGTHIQWNDTPIWSPKTIFSTQHHQAYCECQLFRSQSVEVNSSDVFITRNNAGDFKSLKLRFSNEEHAEAVLKPFIVISSKKRKRHRFGAGYFDSTMTDNFLKNLPGARSSSLGLAGPPGAAPLCIAAETLGFSFGMSISKNFQPSNSRGNLDKSKLSSSNLDILEKCCSRNRIPNVFSIMKKSNTQKGVQDNRTNSIIVENEKHSNISVFQNNSEKEHSSGNSPADPKKSPRKKRKSFKNKNDSKRSEKDHSYITNNAPQTGSSVKSLLSGRFSIDKSQKDSKQQLKTDQLNRQSILDSGGIRKSSLFHSIVEKKDNLISSARQAKKSLIQENEVSESQIETTNEISSFDEGIGVASLVSIPMNVASAAIPVQNAPALVSVASATNSSPKSGDDVSNKSLNDTTKTESNSSKVSTPIYPIGKTYLHEIARSTVSPFVPFLVEMCVTIVEQFGLNCVGIYRMSGSKVAHDFITTELSKNICDMDLKSEKWNDVYSISCVLKTFLRNLPDSLFPRQMYSEFLGACRIEDREKKLLSIQRLLGIMECYPNHPEFRVHRATLRYLVSHLGRVSAKQSTNKMTPYNLALIFAPNLLQPVEETPEIIMQDSKFKIWLVETLIRYHDWIFSPDLGLESGCSIPPDLDEIPIPQVTDEESSMPFSIDVSRAEIEVRPVVADLLHAALLLPPPLTDLESAEEPGPETDRPADLEAVRQHLKAESLNTHEP